MSLIGLLGSLVQRYFCFIVLIKMFINTNNSDHVSLIINKGFLFNRGEDVSYVSGKT